MSVIKEVGNWFKAVRVGIAGVTSNDDLLDRLRHAQLGVHFEEVSEMIAELRGMDRLTQSILTQAMVANHALALHLKASRKTCVTIPDKVAYFDSLVDQLVTVLGCGVHEHMNMEGGLQEVNGSNWSKFVDGKPVFNADMKIQKGPNYYPPNLKPLIVFEG